MQVLNDNGPQSLSRESKRFANEWLFQHVASSLYHPPGREYGQTCFARVRKTVLVPQLVSLIYAMFLKIKH